MIIDRVFFRSDGRYGPRRWLIVKARRQVPEKHFYCPLYIVTGPLYRLHSFHRLASNFSQVCSAEAAVAAGPDPAGAAADAVLGLVVVVAGAAAALAAEADGAAPELVSVILCLTTREAVPSLSFFMKFHASIRDIRVQSVPLTEIISSPTFKVPFLSAAPPEEQS